MRFAEVRSAFDAAVIASVHLFAILLALVGHN